MKAKLALEVYDVKYAWKQKKKTGLMESKISCLVTVGNLARRYLDLVYVKCADE